MDANGEASDAELDDVNTSDSLVDQALGVTDADGV